MYPGGKPVLCVRRMPKNIPPHLFNLLPTPAKEIIMSSDIKTVFKEMNNAYSRT